MTHRWPCPVRPLARAPPWLAQGRTAQGPRGQRQHRRQEHGGGGQDKWECAATAPPTPRARSVAAECHGQLTPDPGPKHEEREGAARRPLPIP